MTLEHPAQKHEEGKVGRFERFAELASNFTSSAVFFVLCVVLVANVIVVHGAALSASWQHLAGDAVSAVALLLLALLKNSERRAEHATQRKLDAIAAALLRSDDGGYARAFAHEVRRFYPFAPFVGGRAAHDLSVRGTRGPRGAMVLLDLYGYHHDPELWARPYDFDPARFLGREPSGNDLVPQGGGAGPPADGAPPGGRVRRASARSARGCPPAR
ncbi:cytochrome P450 [Streptomyces sp. G-G2]|uniref:cytochrome P450 n=1 Tax=Streptomyces sp. G-G2 TaxID=3046201 RepID=UPI0024BB2F5A|nr:cytochrome P450 [Streptomyces sp. G-G2]MDJ0385625.1 cytochrome P450 [Streptomyces sp. G-G2]